jgi:hypothetical protein
MTALNDYLTAGLRVFEEWRPRLEERLTRRSIGLSENEIGEDSEVGSEMINNPSDGPLRPGGQTVELPITLNQLLEKSGRLPSYSVTLGVCDDGLPFLLDLTNPAPGALLICGDRGVGKTALLQSLLSSAARLNPSEQFEMNIITDQPEAFTCFAELEHCQGVFSSDDEVSGDLICELAGMAEERRRTRPVDPAILLGIDHLAKCLEHLDQNAFDRLYWLIRHGPRSRIWVVATLPMERTRTIEARFLSAFRTRLFGNTRDRKLLKLLSEDDELQTDNLKPGQFFIPYGGEWLRLWVCPAGDENMDTAGGVK